MERQAAYLDMTFWHSTEEKMPREGEEVIIQLLDMSDPKIPRTEYAYGQWFESGWELTHSTLKRFMVVAWIEEPMRFRRERNS